MRPQVSYKHIVALLLFVVSSLLTAGQDSPLSQWQNNMLQSNPSLAGSAQKVRINTFFRDQWHKEDAGFRYYGINADMPVTKNMGAGIEIINETMALFNRPSVYAVYSYSTPVNHSSAIRWGMKLGAMQKILSASELKFEEEEHITLESSALRIDAGLGVSTMAKNVFLSFSVEHLTRPYQGLSSDNSSRMNMKWTVDAGYVYKISPLIKKIDVEIMPNILFQQQGRQQNMQISVISQINSLLAGLVARKNFDIDMPFVSIMLGYRTIDFSVSYSYDVDTNIRTTGAGNAHELSLTKTFAIHHKKKHKPIECPSFLK